MNKADYATQRQDPRWQRKRLEIMERDQFKCVDCDSSEKTLNVHHDYYVTGRMPWEYPSFSLSTLCRECHKERHSEPADDEEKAMFEWETEMEWMLRENPKNQGAFWYSAGRLSELINIVGAEEAYRFMDGKIGSEIARIITSGEKSAPPKGEAA